MLYPLTRYSRCGQRLPLLRRALYRPQLGVNFVDKLVHLVGAPRQKVHERQKTPGHAPEQVALPTRLLVRREQAEQQEAI